MAASSDKPLFCFSSPTTRGGKHSDVAGEKVVGPSDLVWNKEHVWVFSLPPCPIHGGMGITPDCWFMEYGILPETWATTALPLVLSFNSPMDGLRRCNIFSCSVQVILICFSFLFPSVCGGPYNIHTCYTSTKGPREGRKESKRIA